MAELQSAIAPAEELTRWVEDARQTTFALMEGLSPDELIGVYKATVNPLIWHMGHIGWFQEKWVLRHLRGHPPLNPEVDKLFDSFEVAHETRWSLDMPGRREIEDYLVQVRDRVVQDVRENQPGAAGSYFTRLSVFHEDMHNEAMIYDRQTLRYASPLQFFPQQAKQEARPLPGDAEVPGGERFLLGATPHQPYLFDNEKWGHPVAVGPFRIARAPVTNDEFAEFVEAGGYRNPEFWSIGGKRWLQTAGAKAPLYWRRATGGGWRQRWFSSWRKLPPHAPVIHVCWYEAEAYCKWAHRRLPTEAEWELAASGEPAPGGGLRRKKRRFPWGDVQPTQELACLDSLTAGPIGVAEMPAGDSAFGCRQMIGNVWEWTADAFFPYPGFVVDPYREYSAPWFGYHKVLRGGSWATRSRMIRNTWRNFFLPDRRDVFAGFRTCALPGKAP